MTIPRTKLQVELLRRFLQQSFFRYARFTCASTSANVYIGALAGGAGYQFHLAVGGLLTYIDAIWNADKVRILEFDAGALVSVIQEDVDAGGVEFGGELLAGGLESGVGNVGDGDDDIEGSDAMPAAKSRCRRSTARWRR